MSNGINGNGGRWQFAFWIVTGFFVFAITIMGQGIIVNDRVRSAEDKAITDKIYTLRKDTNDKFTTILCEMASIKTLITKSISKQ